MVQTIPWCHKNLSVLWEYCVLPGTGWLHQTSLAAPQRHTWESIFWCFCSIFLPSPTTKRFLSLPCSEGWRRTGAPDPVAGLGWSLWLWHGMAGVTPGFWCGTWRDQWGTDVDQRRCVGEKAVVVALNRRWWGRQELMEVKICVCVQVLPGWERVSLQQGEILAFLLPAGVWH